MERATLPEVLRALTVAGATTTLAWTLGAALPGRLAEALDTRAAVDTVVLAGVLTVAGLAAAALALGCCALALTTLARATGQRAQALERASRVLTPAVLRRVVAAGVGVGVGLGGAVTATAAEPDLGWQPTHSVTSGAADPVQVPRSVADAGAGVASSAVPGAHTTAGTGPTETPPTVPDPSPGTTAVRPGDTLWSLAAAQIGGTPTDGEIAAAWPRWYDANRAVIGPDPDLLVPGQVLTVPLPPSASGPGSLPGGAGPSGTTR